MMLIMNIRPFLQELRHEYSRKQSAAHGADGFPTA